MAQEQEASLQSPIEERRAQLEALEAAFTHLKGEVYRRRHAELIRWESVAMVVLLNALVFSYCERSVELIKWRREYLTNLTTLRDLEGCLVEVKRLIVRGGTVMADVED
ncbi:hypothetical protein AMTR_s00027p00181080 [Amborella trichopoda]|uniref:Uncharacterized protein n=1 Tax=Amborella trichopoda TaxID=13333 RepID=W1PRU7_AMBTC|nr:hypothetical protein AMTR_s00027p00181080 [Amborella trichopoda]